MIKIDNFKHLSIKSKNANFKPNVLLGLEI